MVRPPAGAIVVGALLLLWNTERPSLQSLPLPEPDVFFAAVRENIARSQTQQNRFAYKERRTELRINPFGKIGTGAIRVYDVTPAVDGMTISRRLIEHDGKPVTDATPQQRERLERNNRATAGRSLNDIVQTLDFAIDRREMLEGRPAIVVSFKAKPNANPSTRQGKLAKAFAGSIWVDEAAKEVKKVDAIAVDDMSVGFGVVARLNEGAKVSATREPVGANMWLPTSIRLVGDGRAMLFRKLSLDYVIEWFDYREVVK
jgi:hypothetical protein